MPDTMLEAASIFTVCSDQCPAISENVVLFIGRSVAKPSSAGITSREAVSLTPLKLSQSYSTVSRGVTVSSSIKYVFPTNPSPRRQNKRSASCVSVPSFFLPSLIYVKEYFFQLVESVLDKSVFPYVWSSNRSGTLKGCVPEATFA